MPTIRLRKVLIAVNDVSCRLGVWIAASALVVMIVIVLAQIILRTTTGAAIGWSEEIAKTCMTWSALLAAPDGLRRGSHLQLAFFIEAISDKTRQAMSIIVNCALIFACGSFLHHSIAMISDGMKIRSTAIDAPVGLFYLALPVSMFMFILVLVEKIMNDSSSANARKIKKV